jgi:hypothetical protein
VLLLRGRSGTYRGLSGLLPLDRSFLSSSLGIGREIRTAAEVCQSLLAMTSEVLPDNDRHLVQAEIYCCPVGGGEGQQPSPVRGRGSPVISGAMALVIG